MIRLSTIDPLSEIFKYFKGWNESKDSDGFDCFEKDGIKVCVKPIPSTYKVSLLDIIEDHQETHDDKTKEEIKDILNRFKKRGLTFASRSRGNRAYYSLLNKIRRIATKIASDERITAMKEALKPLEKELSKDYDSNIMSEGGVPFLKLSYPKDDEAIFIGKIYVYALKYDLKMSDPKDFSKLVERKSVKDPIKLFEELFREQDTALKPTLLSENADDQSEPTTRRAPSKQKSLPNPKGDTMRSSG